MSIYNNAIFVKRPEDIPKQPHWAIVSGSSYTTETSGQWAPGHGYPASTEFFIEYQAYLKEEDFIAAMKKQAEDKIKHGYGKNVLGLKIAGTYTTRAEISLEDPK